MMNQNDESNYEFSDFSDSKTRKQAIGVDRPLLILLTFSGKNKQRWKKMYHSPIYIIAMMSDLVKKTSLGTVTHSQ